MDYPTSAFRYPCLQQEALARLGEHCLPRGAHAQVTALSALSAAKGFTCLCREKSPACTSHMLEQKPSEDGSLKGRERTGSSPLS